MASDSCVGKLVLVAVLALFLYYFVWVAVFPFLLVNESNLIREFFPPLRYAFLLPAAFGTALLGGVALFTLYHMWEFIGTQSE